jgi:hypothetical protein
MSETETTLVDAGELSPAEKDYFSSRGEKAPANDPAPEADAVKTDKAEAAPQTTAKPEAEGVKPDATDGDGDADKDKQPVSYGALKAERERRKEAERQAKEANDRYTRNLEVITQRLAQMQASGAVPQQPMPGQPGALQAQANADEMPDPEVDFFAHQKWLANKVKAFEEEKQAAIRQQQERQQVEQVQARVLNDWKTIAIETAKEDPEFAQAYEYATRKIVDELVILGYDRAAAVAKARNDELKFAYDNLRQGKNPARVLKQMAEVRGWKYQPPEAAAEAAPEPKRLDTIAKAQDANKSLATAGTGGTARGTLNATALLEMGDDEFAALFKTKKGTNAFKAAAGGA